MRRWGVIVAAVLLLAACHPKEPRQGAESGDTLWPGSGNALCPGSATAGDADTARVEAGTTADACAAAGRRHTLQNDSAQTTHLRVLRKKQTKIYSPTLLVGEWRHGGEHWVYRSDGTGFCWDTDDDVTREEAQTFHWKMADNELEITLTIQMGGVVLKHYTVTFVDAETLAYSDAYGGAYLWDKVK